MNTPPPNRIDRDAITAAIGEWLPGVENVNSWLLWGYGPGFTLQLTQKGRGGVPELVQHLQDDQMQYMLIRLPDQKAANDTVRDIFIGWQGPAMKRIQSAKLKANDFEYIKDSIRPHHAALEAIGKKNFNFPTIMDRSHPLSGSHQID